MLDKLRQMEENYHAMQEKMMDPDVVGDNQQYAQLMREYKHMQPIMEKYHEYLQAQRDFTEAKELLDSETDPELREMAIASEKDLDYLNQWIQDDYYTVKVTDKTKIRIDYEDYQNDASLRGEFVRLVQADEKLSDEEKAQMIQYGIRALEGEEIE